MKKVLLSSVAALAVFSAAAPAFASDNSYSSNALIQKHYVSERDIADQAYAYVEAHPEDVAAAVEKEPSVIAARAELAKAEAIVGHTHEKAVAAAKANLEEVLADATNSQRNRAIQYLQETYRAAAQREGKYWNDPTGVQDNKTKEMRDAEDKALNHGGVTEEQAAAEQAATKPEDGKPGAKDQAKKADEAAKKAGVNAKAGANAKAGQKALPKTHAAK